MEDVFHRFDATMALRSLAAPCLLSSYPLTPGNDFHEGVRFAYLPVSDSAYRLTGCCGGSVPQLVPAHQGCRRHFYAF